MKPALHAPARSDGKTGAKTGAKPVTKRPARALASEVRIIGGLWKRSKLRVSDKPGLRPTPDRVRETLFNWLGQDLGGWRCLDAFAGTGALGFEAASRGAQEVTVVEQDAALVAQLHKARTQLDAQAIRVQRGDGVAAIRQAAPASLDAIFLDPPFDATLHQTALNACARALAPNGFVYLEAPSRWTDALLADTGLVLHRYLKAGAVHAHLLRAGPGAA